MTRPGSLSGMNRLTGKVLSDIDHIAQSIGDILSTPLGTRVMRRDYGSLMFELLDAPLNTATRLLCINAIALAVARWEPRFILRQVLFSGNVPTGQAGLTLLGTLANTPPANTLTALTIPLA